MGKAVTVVLPACLMRCAYQACKIRSVRRVSLRTDAKKPIRQDGLLHLFDAWQFMAGVLPATLSGRCCATFKSAPGGFVLLWRALTDRPHIKQKARSFDRAFRFYLMPGSSLLSHGETPHYHRRYGVSLLSSAWGQVGPPRYSRQANSVY